MGWIDAIPRAIEALTALKKLDLAKDLEEAQNQISKLKAENQSLRKELEVKDKLVFDKNKYWIPNGQSREGPFCSGCVDTRRELIRLHDIGEGSWRCPSCHEVVNDNPSPGVVQARPTPRPRLL